MRRKRDLITGNIVKWIARFNVDGSKQQMGIEYNATYAPVASWISVCLILILEIRQQWTTKQLDFVQAFPQAPVEQELCIEIPKGCILPGKDQKDYAFKVLKNIFGQKQAGKVWNDYLIENLSKQLDFTQSRLDPCILWRGNTIMIIYTDDTIITGCNDNEMNTEIADISSIFKITCADSVSDFLGVNIDRHEDNADTFSQPKLIQTIVVDLGLKQDLNTRPISAPSSKILHAHVNSTPHKEDWHY
jgi:Reverse transcriptase (RNA-dependent DNA polymerase)